MRLKALAGPVDRDGDGRTDLVLFRPHGDSANPTSGKIHIKAGSGCGTGSEISLAGLTPDSKLRVWAVTDMNGDAKGDYLLRHPDEHVWQYYFSQPNGTYTSAGAVLLGDAGAIPL